MPALIDPPPRIPLLMRIGLWFARRSTGKDLLPARLLTWYPPAAVGAGIMEALAVHADGALSARLIKLVRIQASLTPSCLFCFDMNSFEGEAYGITAEELDALRGKTALEAAPSFSARERLAITYARLISQTPLHFPNEFMAQLKANFTERELVVLASTAAQVNYWARLIQALGIPPAGFNEHCEL